LTILDLIITPSETIETALARMTGNRRGILFICDGRLHLAGALSDGDLRRALLDRAVLMAPVGKIMNPSPIAGATVEEAQRLMQEFALPAVPVVAADGRLTAILLAGPGGQQVVEAPLESSEERVAGPQVVALIPARGGSKRVPKKNLANAGGKTLLEWAIETARGAELVSRVLVSTDDPDIASIAATHGAEVPWLRPAELAQDTTTSLAVVEHAFEWCMRNWLPAPEIGLLLEPTAPLRRSEHLDAAVETLLASNADSVVSVSEVPHVLNPEEMLKIRGEVLEPYIASRTMDSRRLRGQQTPVYVQNGLVYAFRVQRLLDLRSLYGRKSVPLVTDWEDFLDIDTSADLQVADLRLKRLAAY